MLTSHGKDIKTELRELSQQIAQMKNRLFVTKCHKEATERPIADR